MRIECWNNCWNKPNLPFETMKKKTSGSLPLVDPLVMQQIGDLELMSRVVVDGFLAGKHRSTHKGGCCEFAQHRPYAPGDEIRRIDWQVYARNDRYFIRQFEEGNESSSVHCDRYQRIDELWPFHRIKIPLCAGCGRLCRTATSAPARCRGVGDAPRTRNDLYSPAAASEPSAIAHAHTFGCRAFR